MFLNKVSLTEAAKGAETVSGNTTANSSLQRSPPKQTLNHISKVQQQWH